MGMKKRVWKEDLKTKGQSTTKKRVKVKLYENPWKAAKGEGEVKCLDFESPWEEPELPLSQNYSSHSVHSTSTSDLAQNVALKKLATSVKSKLELVYPISFQRSNFDGLIESLSKSPGGPSDLVKLSPLNETLVSIDSHYDTQDKSSNSPNMPVYSLVKLQNTLSEGFILSASSASSTSLAEYDPDREHTKDCYPGGGRVSRQFSKRNTANLSISQSVQHIRTVSGSVKKTPTQGDGAYPDRVLCSPTLATAEFTSVDKPLAKTKIKDINERLMAGSLMLVGKKEKKRNPSVLTSMHKRPLSGRVLLPEPPVNYFLKTDENEIAKSALNKRTRKKSKVEYGSSKFLKWYKVVQKIGSGEFGTVLKVISRYDGCTYAVKKVNKMSIPLRLRVREMFCMSAIEKKGTVDTLVKYYSGWIEDNIVYIAMEYCERGSVEALQSSSSTFKLTRTILSKLVRQVSSGLAHMHSMNLVHMDVKPGNILISAEWNFKLGDFGHTTKLSEDNGRPIYRVRDGDKRYISKEVLNEDYSDLRKSDIYSLGASCYELARGKALPDKGKEWADLRNGQLTKIKGYPKNLNNLLISCMANRPADRPLAKDVCITLGEPTVVKEILSLPYAEVQNLESALKAKREDVQKLRLEISKLKENTKILQDKYKKLVQQQRNHANKQQFIH